MNYVTQPGDTQLRQLERKIKDIEGLKVRDKQEEANYPVDSLVVKQTRYGMTIPKEIEDLVKTRKAEVIDVQASKNQLWIIPHRGHGDYYKDLAEEDIPQEIYEVVKQASENEEQALIKANQVVEVAKHVIDRD